MKLIGPHLPVGKGLHTVQEQMERLSCETCGLFLKNQRRYGFSPLDEEAAAQFRNDVKNPAILLPHGSYLINLANPETFEKGYSCLVDDLRRCNELGIRLYNVHPGSDTGKLGIKAALDLIAKNLNRVMREVPGVIILIENMAGQGRVCGKNFDELREIISGVEDKDRIGITLDTCHMFCAGYDIRTSELFEEVMKEFDRKVGLKYLKAMHLNDSMNEFNTKKDHHESIGKGKIGVEAFRYIMNSKYFENIPMILETPDPTKYAEEIALLKSFIEAQL